MTVKMEPYNGTLYSKVVIEARQNQVVAQTFAEYIMNDTSKALEVFEHVETEQTKALTDYRYTGESPNNYVYFGCEGDACTEDNLYRIIGVIPTQSEIGKDKPYENRVKLIKADYYEGTAEIKGSSDYTVSKKGYYWNNSNNNKWETSSLQTKVLNGEYWNKLAEYQNYISTAVWYLGAPTFISDNKAFSNNLYNIERSNTSGKSGGATNFISKIGLIYPSDYGYSFGEKNITENINEIVKTQNAWMNIDKTSEWLISPDSTYNGGLEGVGAICIFFGQSITGSGGVSYPDRKYAIRPTFYLKDNVLYKSGDGTRENPYRINIDA